MPWVKPNSLAWPVLPVWFLNLVKGTHLLWFKTSFMYLMAVLRYIPLIALPVSKVFLKWTLRSLPLALTAILRLRQCSHRGKSPLAGTAGSRAYLLTIVLFYGKTLNLLMILCLWIKGLVYKMICLEIINQHNSAIYEYIKLNLHTIIFSLEIDSSLLQPVPYYLCTQ